jgi:hypothetical protein
MVLVLVVVFKEARISARLSYAPPSFPGNPISLVTAFQLAGLHTVLDVDVELFRTVLVDVVKIVAQSVVVLSTVAVVVKVTLARASSLFFFSLAANLLPHGTAMASAVLAAARATTKS